MPHVRTPTHCTTYKLKVNPTEPPDLTYFSALLLSLSPSESQSAFSLDRSLSVCSYVSVCLFVCVSPRKLITSHSKSGAINRDWLYTVGKIRQCTFRKLKANQK